MGKTWKDVLVPFLGQDYPLPMLVELWSREDTYLNYDK